MTRWLPLVVLAAACSGACAQMQRPVHLAIDGTDLPRRLLRATQTLPVPAEVARDGGDWALWYPKWVPGSHAPGGPVQNLGGITFTDQDGRTIEWTRTPGEVCRFVAHVPKGTATIDVHFTYITNQSDENSHGLDSFGTESIALISANTVLVYPEGAVASELAMTTSLALPEGWSAATALPRIETADGSIAYDAVTLETLVDSPIMAAAYVEEFPLNEDGVSAPPHRLRVLSESESAVDIDQDIVAGYSRMVTQAARLFGSHPFDSFDILVGVTDLLGRNGLEHLRSTMNIIPLKTLESTDNLKGWDRMLIPHEYVHAWCGKYRRPAGMVTPDYNTPKDTDLLWVYDGLTTYLGELLEVRAGLMKEDEYRWDVEQTIRGLRFQQGRRWRSLADTGAASHTLRAHSPNWSTLRRGQDYYGEGGLFWMEADAMIRNETKNKKSLDDFCQAFFRFEPDAPTPRGYTWDEVIDTLNIVHKHDWDAFFRDRIRDTHRTIPLSVVEELGYTLEYTAEPPKGPNDAKVGWLDARDSIGASFGSGGQVHDVQLGSPADRAGLGPGLKIVGVNGHVWSTERFTDALKGTPVRGTIEFMTISGDTYVTKTVEYDGGPRFMTLRKTDKGPDPLAEIAKPREH